MAYERISAEWKDLDIYILRGAVQEQVIRDENGSVVLLNLSNHKPKL